MYSLHIRQEKKINSETAPLFRLGLVLFQDQGCLLSSEWIKNEATMLLEKAEQAKERKELREPVEMATEQLIGWVQRVPAPPQNIQDLVKKICLVVWGWEPKIESEIQGQNLTA